MQADDARQRALREMMNATLDVTARDRRAQELVHEPWMDLPRSQGHDAGMAPCMSCSSCATLVAVLLAVVTADDSGAAQAAGGA
ncbi:hypothetical protein HaLaN_03803 [Haematococcus lacustris]|uniref:Uncharacterized protein n=1 Tax=Haematococcus lacustris TaxID=44745 RepID=A0A699YH59_HAELA|nr:hypothetical protein HaLaN_03803 [Haematococcus lacustris]